MSSAYDYALEGFYCLNLAISGPENPLSTGQCFPNKKI